MSMRRRLVAVALCALVAATGCTKHNGSRTATTVKGNGPFYLSLGDSYATGTQHTSRSLDESTHNGFADQVTGLAKAKGYDLTLVNLGCGGASVKSVLRQKGCGNPAVDGFVDPARSQVDAAVRFIDQHPGRIGLVTVIVGGDVLVGCAPRPDFAGCVAAALRTTAPDLRVLLQRLRAATGASVPIVGLTYPDVFLGAWTWPGVPHARVLASRAVYQDVFNPALAAAYATAGATFVDVTAATGAYQPLDSTTVVQAYGEVPEAVARACDLSLYCLYHDVHASTQGYQLMGELVVNALPARGPA